VPATLARITLMVTVPATLRGLSPPPKPQRPAAQVEPAGQTVPQAPQLLESVCVLISQPSVAEPLQLAKPVAHAAMLQVLAAQEPVALAGAQRRPQPPQLLMSVASVDSQPSVAARLQSAKPAPQTKLHAEAAHTGVALARGGHVTEHAPQLDGSLEVDTHTEAQVA